MLSYRLGALAELLDSGQTALTIPCGFLYKPAAYLSIFVAENLARGATGRSGRAAHGESSTGIDSEPSSPDAGKDAGDG